MGRRHSCARPRLSGFSDSEGKTVLTAARCLLCLGGHANFPGGTGSLSCSRGGLGGQETQPECETMEANDLLPLSQPLPSPRPVCSSHC